MAWCGLTFTVVESHCELLHWANTHATTRGMVALGAVTLGDPLSLLGECDANALFFLFFCPFLFYLLLEDCAFVTHLFIYASPSKIIKAFHFHVIFG